MCSSNYVIKEDNKQKSEMECVLFFLFWDAEFDGRCLHLVQIPLVQFEPGVGRAELRGNDREGFLFLIQVEGAAQECSSGSESRHPDGRQMLENISEQHVHFS